MFNYVRPKRQHNTFDVNLRKVLVTQMYQQMLYYSISLFPVNLILFVLHLLVKHRTRESTR